MLKDVVVEHGKFVLANKSREVHPIRGIGSRGIVLLSPFLVTQVHPPQIPPPLRPRLRGRPHQQLQPR